MSTTTDRRGWTIDVCRTCDRLAQWPFCEHRDQPLPAGTSWCVAVDVIPASRRDRTVPAGKQSDLPRRPPAYLGDEGGHPEGVLDDDVAVEEPAMQGRNRIGIDAGAPCQRGQVCEGADHVPASVIELGTDVIHTQDGRCTEANCPAKP